MKLIIGIVFTASFFSILNSGMVNVALPTIMNEFGVDFQYSTWLYSGYMLPYAVAMPIFGRLGDIYGQKNIFLIGVVIFTIGSLLCSIAGGFWLLLAFRAVQAIGAAAIMPNAMVLITSPFNVATRAKVLGWWGMVSSTGSLIGPTLGGVLTEHVGWHSIFYVNVPFAIAVILLGYKFIPIIATVEKKPEFDKLGAVFLVISMVALMLSITLMKEISLYLKEILLLFTIFVVFLGLFIWWEQKQKYPLVSITLFSNIPFSATIMTSFIQSMAMFGGLLLIPMYLQKVHDFSPTYSGILILPMSVAMMVMAPLMGNISTERKRQKFAFTGMIVLVAGLGIFSTLKFESRYLVLAAALLTTGIGLGISGTPLSTSVANLVSREQMGVASGIFNMMRFLGGVVGSTIFGVYLQNRISYHTQGSDLALPGMLQTVMTEAFHDVYILAMIFASFGVITALGMRYREKDTVNAGRE